jgi:SAM-dependent methyltransferase
MATEKEYVLGTHDAEIERLGLQHRVWRPHVTRTWRRAGFSVGQTIVDVGCGPGYAALDLAEIVGPSGRLVAIDRSRRFLDALEAGARVRGLAQIQTHELDLDVGPLPDVRADGAWARWVFSFVTRPEALLRRLAEIVRPGGTIALYEYVDYRAWRLSPRSAVFEEFVTEVIASWRANGGEPDIGLELPRWLESLGFELLVTRPISEVARPGDFLWQWPKAFVGTGIQRLVDLGRVDPARARSMQQAFDDTERTPGAYVINPTVLEIVARRK